MVSEKTFRNSRHFLFVFSSPPLTTHTHIFLSSEINNYPRSISPTKENCASQPVFSFFPYKESVLATGDDLDKVTLLKLPKIFMNPNKRCVFLT